MPKSPPLLLHDILDDAARRSARQVAVGMSDGEWTYAQLAEVSHAFAAWLLEQGVGPGDRVLVHLRNSMELAAMLFGASRAGAVYVPVSHEMRPYHLRAVLAECQPALVVTDSAWRMPAESTAYGRPVVRRLADLWPEVEAACGRRVVSPARPDDVALLLYTSGSTAAPKGVVCPHERILFAAQAIASRLGYRSSDRVFVRLPLSFDYGLYQLLLCCLAAATAHLSVHRSTADLINELRTSGSTVVPVVPSLAVILNRLAERRRMDVPVRLFTNTGARLSPAEAARLRRNFPGASVVFMFGLTECKRVSISEPDADLQRPGSVGTPLEGTEVVIQDGRGRPLPPGEPGEITVRGFHVMDGYYGDPRLSAQRFDIDPITGTRTLRTGDFGYLDTDGHLYFHWRHDDIFKRHGLRMSTTEIEAAAMDVQTVTAAVAVPDHDGGDLLRLAFVGDVAPDRLRTELAARIEPAKQPDHYVVFDQFPLTANGKVDRTAVATAVSRASADQGFSSMAQQTDEQRRQGAVDVYTVTPETVGEDEEFSDGFRPRLTATAHAADGNGWSGILVPHNMHEVDPWMVATYIGSVTNRLIPLIAVQPASTPPHTAAACAAAYATLYDRPLYFNLVAGAREDEMQKIGDDLTHDQRYDRIREYGRVLRALLRGETVHHDGEHYRYRKFHLEPRPDVLEHCKIFVAGSSPASFAVATDIADVVVTHPEPFPKWRSKFLLPLQETGYSREVGIRIGIVCRPSREEAWQIAADRFPESWFGRQITLLKTRSSNVWARQLAELATTEEHESRDETGPQGTYWLGAFRSGRASAPFLVGSYADVGDALGQYVGAGVGHVLLNGVHDDDYQHTLKGIELATTSAHV